ncbi:hypothetical protein GMORB2_4997 [Geosmithia morbida]|uniref:Pentatricopeptide repeat domain-containing protein n=1 Tax=Geosmithia morbida TaxID=1094350 RepID=A0A9P4YYY8_9HYPO|nr:uncharacterized protein GMORB2_4997 [Geosmithia morbida]KAF4124331.1 hypothetical protein GMORB2_4997 [Geosmithia morbida]
MFQVVRQICRAPVRLVGHVAAPADGGGVLRPPSSRERNRFFREAFTQAPEEDVEKKLSSPFVPPARDYPSATATAESLREAWQHARTQAGFDTIWSQYKVKEHRLVNGLDWRDMLEHLQRTTVRMSSGAKQIAAMRIVLPGNWDLDVSNRNVDFVDSITGLKERLRVYMDQRDASAIVVRGQSATLAKAADELLGVCRHVKIYQLGELAECDYETRQLWPAIDDATVSTFGSVPADKLGSVWVHREQAEERWIETRYEDHVPRPAKWTSSADFETYIAGLAGSRLRPHLALPLYSQWSKSRGRAGEQVDTNGIRVGLMMDAFMDPAARRFITAPALNMALSFMSQRGGHRASADRLFTQAEEWGVPMDTGTFNIMLEGYVTKRDFRFFHMFLRKMRARYFAPNTRTWLLLLRLVQQDDLRRQIVVAMYELGLFSNAATNRAVASIMAQQDAYSALRSGRSLADLMRDQAARYGDAWLSRDALNAILREYLRFHGESLPDPAAEYGPVVEAAAGLAASSVHDGRPLVDVSTVNVVLEHAVRNHDWPAALWALDLAHRLSIDLVHDTYHLVVRLAVGSRRPHALAAAFFHASHEFKLRHQPRRMLLPIITSGLVPVPAGADADPDGTTNSLRVPLLSAEMASSLREQPMRDPYKAVNKASRAVTMISVPKPQKKQWHRQKQQQQYSRRDPPHDQEPLAA